LTGGDFSPPVSFLGELRLRLQRAELGGKGEEAGVRSTRGG
jgi:hypothetical protein